MNRTLKKYNNSSLRKFIRRHKKYLPVIFFIGGFIFDTLTLGRIDQAYSLTVLCLHMTAVTITLYLYNLVDDGIWENTFLERLQLYFPLAIQFFFGALSSAYVVYFSRSVSLSKTITFFALLVVLLFANEILKKRISNKYLQFSLYFFVSFTFFTIMIPVFIKEMNTFIFIFSGLVSLVITFLLITLIYWKSPSMRVEIRIPKLVTIILLIYVTINSFYFTNLIPPVPLALSSGMVAHHVQKEKNNYFVTYERDDWYIFWRDHRLKFVCRPGDRVYVFASIFAPTKIKKSIFHRWEWFNKTTDDWEVVDKIGYKIIGGRNAGYRGYTYKDNVKPGLWKVDVITEEGLIIGVIDFKIIMDTISKPKRLIKQKF